jgi:hypothetical protein
MRGSILKRKLLFILLAAGLVVLVSAQGTERGGSYPRQSENRSGSEGPRRWMQSAETVTVSGSLIVAHGSPAIKSGDVTYLISGVNRLVGFIDGFKEGAQVSIEGSAINISRDEKLKFLRPSKLTLNGRSYDLTFPEMNFGPRSSNRFPAPPRGPRPNAPWGPYSPQMRHHWQYL